MTETVNPYDVERGDELILNWRPYMWAKEKLNLESPTKGEVVDTCGYPESGHMWEVKIRPEGKDFNLTAVIDKGYVTTGKGGSPFDKGRFTSFERQE